VKRKIKGKFSKKKQKKLRERKKNKRS